MRLNQLKIVAQEIKSIIFSKLDFILEFYDGANVIKVIMTMLNSIFTCRRLQATICVKFVVNRL